MPTIKRLDSIGNYVDIDPVFVRFNDEIQANAMTLMLQNDNLDDGCVFEYRLVNLSPFTYVETVETPAADPDSPPTTQEVTRNSLRPTELYKHTVGCVGSDYAGWNGSDNLFPYSFVGDKIKVVVH